MADGIEFDWDEANLDHIARHNVSREEAEQVFSNGVAVIDYQMVGGEERWLVTGRSNAGRFLTIPWTFREDAVRVITAWDATKEEEAIYWAEKGGQ